MIYSKRKHGYDKIHIIYSLLGDNYKKERKKAVEMLQLKKEDTVLDLCCGIGRNIKYIFPKIGEKGKIIGVDVSLSMLQKAQIKFASSNIFILCCDAEQLSMNYLKNSIPYFKGVNKIICTLGLTVVPNWERVFNNSIDLLEKDGIYTILDLYWDKSSLISRAIDWFASADSSRKTWKLLEAHCQYFQQECIPFLGGQIIISSGKKK